MARHRSPEPSIPHDRPLPPRLSDALDVIDLADIASGEWSGVELTGSLPEGFDEPLLLTEVRLRGALLAGVRLEGSRFVDVAVVASELSGAELHETSFTRVEVLDSRLSGAQLAQMRLRDVRFVDSRLDDVNLAMTTAERVRFERCRMDRADVRGAVLQGVAWFDCDLTEAEFGQVKVERAQLHGSRIDGLRGAIDLAPLSIDADQFTAFATHVLAARGIVVTDRDER